MRGGGLFFLFIFYLCFCILVCLVLVLVFSLVNWPSPEVTMSECILSAPRGPLIFLLDIHFAVDSRQE